MNARLPAAALVALLASAPSVAARADEATQAQLDRVERKLDYLIEMMESGRYARPTGRLQKPPAPRAPIQPQPSRPPGPTSGDLAARPPEPKGTAFDDLVGTWTQDGPPSVQIDLRPTGDVNLSSVGGGRFVPDGQPSGFVLTGTFEGRPFGCAYKVVWTARGQASWTATSGPAKACPSGTFDKTS